MIGDIDEAAETGDRIDEKSRRDVAGTFEVALQQLVGEDQRRPQVAQGLTGKLVFL